MPAGGIPTYADSVLTQENMALFPLIHMELYIQSWEPSGPAPVLHLSVELDIMHCEKPMKGIASSWL